jgi:hypothetical protein
MGLLTKMKLTLRRGLAEAMNCADTVGRGDAVLCREEGFGAGASRAGRLENCDLSGCLCFSADGRRIQLAF